MTFRPTIFSISPQLRRRQLACRTRRRRRAVSAHDAASTSIFPAPRNVEGSGLGRSCSTRSTTCAPAASASPASSSSERSASRRRARPATSPTSAARSQSFATRVGRMPARLPTIWRPARINRTVRLRDVHDRRWRTARRRAGIEQQIQTAGQRRGYLVRVVGGRLAADVRARRGHRTFKRRTQRARDRVRRERERRRPAACGHFRRQRARRAHDERERPGPESCRRGGEPPAPSHRCHCVTCPMSAATSGSARSSGRPLTANTRATATRFHGSAASP